MKYDDFASIADEVLVSMAWGMGLASWHLSWTLSPVCGGSGASAEVAADSKYETASMTFDPLQIEDREDALRVIRHELLHVLHASFNPFKEAVLEVEGLSLVAKSMADHLWSVGEERTVLALEQMLITAQVDAERFIARGHELRAAAGKLEGGGFGCRADGQE